jgi:hypothetical protein
MTTERADWHAISVLASISAWMPQADPFPMHPAGLNLPPSKLERHDECKSDDSKSVTCLTLEHAKLASICAWLPASNSSASSGEANLDGADSDTASMLSSISAWLPQTAVASNSAPKTQHPQEKPIVLPTLLAQALLLPSLPGQCDEVIQSSPQWQPKQSPPVLAPVQATAGLSSTATLATGRFSASGVRTGEGQVSSRAVGSDGSSGEGAPSAGRVAVGGRMHLEPLPRLTTTRRTRG